MDLRKWISSPVGLIAAGTVVLAMSPEVRKAGRKLMVKGTAGSFNLMDQIKNKLRRDGYDLGMGISPKNENDKGNTDRMESVNSMKAENEDQDVVAFLQSKIQHQLAEIEKLRSQLEQTNEQSDSMDQPSMQMESPSGKTNGSKQTKRNTDQTGSQEQGGE
jgi:outer membrane lipoprotein SlyB